MYILLNGHFCIHDKENEKRSFFDTKNNCCSNALIHIFDPYLENYSAKKEEILQFCV